MILGAFLIFASQMGAADNANLALTTCGFAAHRSASEQNLDSGQFAARLSSDCAAQMAEMRRSIIALDISRGRSRAAAARKADSLIADFNSFFKNQYARRAGDERKLRELERAMELEGKAIAR